MTAVFRDMKLIAHASISGQWTSIVLYKSCLCEHYPIQPVKVLRKTFLRVLIIIINILIIITITVVLNNYVFLHLVHQMTVILM